MRGCKYEESGIRGEARGLDAREIKIEIESAKGREQARAVKLAVEQRVMNVERGWSSGQARKERRSS